MVRTLVAQLESSNVIVHIVPSSQMPGGIGGTTQFVTSRGGYRYLRITLAADLGLRVRSAILGHELQHACEVARPTADDVEQHAGVVRERGPPRRRRTSRPWPAIETERRGAQGSVRPAATLQAEPVVKFDH